MYPKSINEKDSIWDTLLDVEILVLKDQIAVLDKYDHQQNLDYYLQAVERETRAKCFTETVWLQKENLTREEGYYLSLEKISKENKEKLEISATEKERAKQDLEKILVQFKELTNLSRTISDENIKLRQELSEKTSGLKETLEELKNSKNELTETLQKEGKNKIVLEARLLTSADVIKEQEGQIKLLKSQLEEARNKVTQQAVMQIAKETLRKLNSENKQPNKTEKKEWKPHGMI